MKPGSSENPPSDRRKDLRRQTRALARASLLSGLLTACFVFFAYASVNLTFDDMSSDHTLFDTGILLYLATPSALVTGILVRAWIIRRIR